MLKAKDVIEVLCASDKYRLWTPKAHELTEEAKALFACEFARHGVIVLLLIFLLNRVPSSASPGPSSTHLLFLCPSSLNEEAVPLYHDKAYDEPQGSEDADNAKENPLRKLCDRAAKRDNRREETRNAGKEGKPTLVKQCVIGHHQTK